MIFCSGPEGERGEGEEDMERLRRITSKDKDATSESEFATSESAQDRRIKIILNVQDLNVQETF